MTRPEKKRRRWPWLLLGAAAASLWFVWQQEAIQTEAIYLTDSRLPAAFDSLRIAHLSDLHGKEFGPDSARLLEAVAAAEPDLIAVTGDLIDRAEQLDMVPALASGLSAIAPTYYVTGNHEWAVGEVRALKALLEENGVTVLTNEAAALELEGETILLAGIDDPNGPADQKTGSELKAELAEEYGEDTYTILLAHRNTVEDYVPWGYSLTLCGHGHGGVFRIPLLDQGLLSTDRTLFPEYDEGLYQAEGDFYVVSRGLGSNTVPIRAFRLFNRPHLPVVILQKGT